MQTARQLRLLDKETRWGIEHSWYVCSCINIKLRFWSPVVIPGAHISFAVALYFICPRTSPQGTSSLRKIHPCIHVLYRGIKIECTSLDLIFFSALNSETTSPCVMSRQDQPEQNRGLCLRWCCWLHLHLDCYSNTDTFTVYSLVAAFVLHNILTHRFHNHFHIWLQHSWAQFSFIATFEME